MAEHFHGRRITVHTSNGGAEQMLNAWLALGRRMDHTDDLDAVLTFLQYRVQLGAGWKAFALDPPPTEIESPGRLACFARTVAAFAEQLMQEVPDPTLTTIDWDRNLRLQWLANMLDLLEILADVVGLPLNELLSRLPADAWRDAQLCAAHEDRAQLLDLATRKTT